MSSRPLIKESLTLLNLCGLDPRNAGKFKTAKMITCGAFLASFTFEILLSCLFKWEGFSSIEGLTTLVSVFQILIKLVVMVVHRRDLVNVLNKMDAFWALDKYGSEVKKEISTIFEIVKKVAKCMVTFNVIVLPAYVFKPIFGNVEKLPFPMFHPQDLSNPLNFYLALLYQACGLLVVFLTLYAFDGMFISLIITIITELRLLKKGFELTLIDRNIKGDTRESLSHVYTMISHHNLILGCIEDISRIYSIILLNIYFCNMTCMCIGLLGVISTGMPPSVDGLYKFGSYVLYYAAQLFFYCIAGNNLTDENSSVSDTIYGMDWYVKTQPELRKSFSHIIQRANKVEKLTAGGMFSLDLESFKTVINSALSFFMLVQALYNDNK